MLTVILTAVKAGTPLFPGALIDWTTEQYALLRAALELENEREAEAYEKSRKENEEKSAIEAEKRRLAALPPGSKSGGGAPLIRFETSRVDDDVFDEAVRWFDEVTDGPG